MGKWKTKAKMKINEIINLKENLSGAGLEAEAQRAQIEFRELKKIDAKFATEFMKNFQLYGGRSVDQAYQATAQGLRMNVSDAQAIGKATGVEKQRLIKDFVSAIPADAYAKMGTKTTGGGRGKYTHYRDGSERGGGAKIRGQKDYDDSRFGRSTIGKIAKDVANVLNPKVLGKSKSADFGAGMDLGDKLGNLVSEPVKSVKRRGG